MCHDKTVKVARKNCDKFITPTVRVMGQALFICLGTRKLSRYLMHIYFILYLFSVSLK
jgi:hypothetical protein